MGVCGSRRARDNVLLLCICAGAFGGTVRDVARANTIMCAIFDNTTAIAPDVTQLEKQRLGQLGEKENGRDTHQDHRKVIRRRKRGKMIEEILGGVEKFQETTGSRARKTLVYIVVRVDNTTPPSTQRLRGR